MLRNASETLQGISFFATVLGGAAVTAVTLGSDRVGTPGTILLCLGVLLLTSATAGLWYYLKHVAQPATYRILNLDSVLEVESVGSHHRFQYTLRQHVQALRNGVRQIDANAHWTGRSSQGAIRLDPLVSDHVVHDGRRPEDDGRISRWIYVGDPVARGQEFVAGIRQVHEDDLEPQRPYFRETGGRYRTRRMTVVARFPIREDPQLFGNVEGLVWNKDRQRLVCARVPLERSVDTAGGTVEYRVTVERPRRHYSYGLRWHWGPQRLEAARSSALRAV
ncbi:hypothetical protein [Flindersiella endophytica]